MIVQVINSGKKNQLTEASKVTSKTMDVRVADGVKMKKLDTSTVLNLRPQN